MPPYEKLLCSGAIPAYPAELAALEKLRASWGLRTRMDVVRKLTLESSNPEVVAQRENFHTPRKPQSGKKLVQVAQRL